MVRKLSYAIVYDSKSGWRAGLEVIMRRFPIPPGNIYIGFGDHARKMGNLSMELLICNKWVEFVESDINMLLSAIHVGEDKYHHIKIIYKTLQESDASFGHNKLFLRALLLGNVRGALLIRRLFAIPKDDINRMCNKLLYSEKPAKTEKLLQRWGYV